MKPGEFDVIVVRLPRRLSRWLVRRGVRNDITISWIWIALVVVLLVALWATCTRAPAPTPHPTPEDRIA